MTALVIVISNRLEQKIGDTTTRHPWLVYQDTSLARERRSPGSGLSVTDDSQPFPACGLVAQRTKSMAADTRPNMSSIRICDLVPT